jgi:phage gp36-like protein
MYATIEDMLDAFGLDEMIALTDRENAGEVNEAVGLEALARASSEADSYLSVRYLTPVALPDKALVDAVCQIARYRLTGGHANETESVRERYDRAIDWLRRIARGEADLPGMRDPAATAGDVLFSTGRRVFKRPYGEPGEPDD